MVKKIEARTENPGGESRTGSGDAAGVESLADLAREAGDLQRDEAEAVNAKAEKREEAQQAAAVSQLDAAATELAGVLGSIRDMAGEMVEELNLLPKGRTGAIWTDDKLLGICRPLVVIAERHGEGLAELFAQYGPYLALFAATAMPAVATVKAVREHKASRTVDAEVREAGAASGQQ